MPGHRPEMPERASKPNLLAVIPARGNSQRLPGKNIRPLAGKPLIAWTIEAAIRSGVFSDVLVTTDNEDIREVAVRHGASAPWLRPAELATDSASSLDVVLHAVETWQAEAGVRLDGAMLLQPTSPFRRPETIRRAVATFLACGGQSVIGVSPAATHPYWCLVMDTDGGLQPFSAGDGLTLNSQSLPPVYAVNGVLYLTAADYLLKNRKLYTPKFRPEIIHDPVECLDIDTPFDWAVAETFSNRLKEGQP